MILGEQKSLNIKNPLIDNKDFLVKIADTEEEVQQAFRLRFEVFNLEMGEGLDSSFTKGLDVDEFDQQFLHLVILDKKTDKVIATYRVQDYNLAQQAKGFYSAERFNFNDLPMDIQHQGIEASRACVARPYRNSIVFYILWKGLANLMKYNNIRYFFGCSSIMSTNSQDANGIVKLFKAMAVYHKNLKLKALEDFYCPYEDIPADISNVHIPPLFSIYLRFNCHVCSEPCFDRDFKTITFLILLDVDKLPQRIVEYFSNNQQLNK